MARWLTIEGIGDGSAATAGAPYADLNNQANLSSGDPRVFYEADDTADHFIPMLAPGVDNSSANGTPFAVLTSTTGTESSPLAIEGRYADGRPGLATLRSQRIYPYTTDNDNHLKWEGQAGIALQTSHVVFRRIRFRNMGMGCVLFNGTTRVSNITFEECDFENVRRGIWIRSSSPGVEKLRVRRCTGIGSSKGFIRWEGASKDIVMEDCDFDLDFQDGEFAIGVHLDGYDFWSSSTTYSAGTIVALTATGKSYKSLQASNLNHSPDTSPSWWQEWGDKGNSDVRFERVKVRNARDSQSQASYWNGGDGFASERNDHDVTLIDCEAYNCTDGGFDMKADNLKMVRPIAGQNKRNYRLWDSTQEIIDITSIDPFNWGGTGGSAHVWMNDGGATVRGGKLISRYTTPTFISNDSELGLSANIERVEIQKVPGGTLYSGPINTREVNISIIGSGAPGLADLLSIAPVTVFGLRRLSWAATYAIQVRNTSTNALKDIGFTSSGGLDTAAIAAHCGSSDGTIVQWYNQTGLGAALTTTAASREYKIYDGATQSVTTKGPNGKPAALITVQDSGYFHSHGATLADKISGVIVGAFTNTATTTNSPRYMSLTTTGGNNDANSSSRAILVYRAGNSTPAATWQQTRNSGTIGVNSTYSQLDEVISIFDGTNRLIYVNNGTPATTSSTGTFSGATLSIGYTGSTFSSCPGGYLSEGMFFAGALVSADRTELHNDHVSFFGTP